MHISSYEGPCEFSGPVSGFYWSLFQDDRQRISILVLQFFWIEDVQLARKNPSISLSHTPAPSSIPALTRLVPLLASIAAPDVALKITYAFPSSTKVELQLRIRSSLFRYGHPSPPPSPSSAPNAFRKQSSCQLEFTRMT
jgi:hypothetical protein